MKRFSLVSFVTFLLFLFQNIDIQAQKNQNNIVFEWQPLRSYTISEDETISLLYFSGAIAYPKCEQLPLYFDLWPAEDSFTDYKVTLSELQFQPLTAEERACVPAAFSETEFVASAKAVTQKKKNYIALSILPVRKNGNGYEKLVSVTVSVQGTNKKTTPTRTHQYASNSVLRSGNWYEVSVPKSGVYKVTYADLSSLGVPLNGLASNRISIFGNGGGMLPEANALSRYDDLQELPILMHDGGDGIFNDGDYFIFYANGPHSWQYNSSNQRFTHSFNLYSSVACYFVNVDAGVGTKRRIEQTDYSALSPTTTASTYMHYGFYEVDKVNIAGSGRGWYGDRYDGTTTYTYGLSFPSLATGVGRLTASVAAASGTSSYFSVSIQGTSLGNISVSPLASVDYAKTASRDFSLSPVSGANSVTVSYSKPSSSSIGYLDYLEWQMPCQLWKESYQTPFCCPDVVSSGSIARIDMGNMSSDVKIWDVTELTSVSQMVGTLTGSSFSFVSPMDSLRQFVAFTDNDCYSVTPVGKVDNQDLHGTSQVDMVIVAYPDFLNQAERLAAYRRSHDGLTVKVVTPQQVYNEFSSGSQDITAIRDYMKMIYEKSNAVYPKYLLLFGRPSYDYRFIEENCKCYVPNYQSVSTLNEYDMRSNDDYFGILGDNAGAGSVGMVDVAVGRFPVSSESQAQIAVDKTIAYSTRTILGANTLTSNFGSWKNIVTFVADDENGITHVVAADSMASNAERANANINVEKIYLDAYPQVTYSSSARYPEVTAAINNRMNAGCLLFTYVGHGGKNGWAHERVLELTDISNWANRYNQPWMVTLACEFGWYDRSLLSPAEMAFLNANGGVAGMVTTSRVAFTVTNESYGLAFFNHIFDRNDHVPQTIGEINRMTKNLCGGAGDTKNMIYVMGDPAMQLAVPLYSVVTDSINGIATSVFTDTLRALSKVTISGHIEDNFGNMLPAFNGSVLPSVYDKKSTEHTLQNDPSSYYFEFQSQKNILFKGNVTVKDGRFSFSFILPKDINYIYGTGKMSYYAFSQDAEASGSYTQAIIGGMSDTPITDDKGPELELFMNDEKFVNGGTVNSSPTLLVKLKDDYGINTTGNGIGHDLVAIIDGEKQTVLNNYYEAERDSFNCGTVRYLYEDLEPGSHKVKVRAWDILNNVSESELEFVVANDADLTLNHVLNYPNPFTTNTSFFFEHNQPNTELNILITIYTISGKVVKTIESTQVNDGFRSSPIPWDGRDDYGDRLGKGTYLYRMKVRTSDGKQAEKFEKIVIL